MLPTLEHVQFEDADALLSGEFAMQALLEAVLERGAHKGSLQAKAFGGGTIFDTPGQSITIGLLNTAFTKAWLRREAIPLLASDLLGPWSRTVLFLPASGEVFCRRRVTNMATAEVIARETRAYKQTLVVRPSVTTSPTSGLDHG
jgi:chemotaxis protein CheD